MKKVSSNERREALLELARRDFFYFCYCLAPDFYKKSRTFLVNICRQLQDFYFSTDQILILNLPPRHGKSRTASLFAQWIFGQNKNEKIMTGSYNEILSSMFSKNVRNSIAQIKADPEKIVYNDIFPDISIEKGSAAANLWSLDGAFNSYLATSPQGTATGFGCSIMIIDDLIKNAAEAADEAVLQKHWEWFANTMLSRLEENGKIIIVMTRWASADLAGRALAHFSSCNYGLRHISLSAVSPDGSMLCSDLLSKKSFQAKIKAMGYDIVSANYMQEPIDIKGRLYSSFKTYSSIPLDSNGLPLFSEIRNYTDTADMGNDFLCSINYGIYQNEAYILYVIYSKEPMEVTEPLTAKMLYDGKVCCADIESNNGGRGFARAIERILRQDFHSNKTVISCFSQTKNKASRIISNSTWVMQHIYFPVNWKDKFPDFFAALTKYQRQGKNAHDDAPDAVTGIAERINSGRLFSFD